jgi:UDP-N-acetylglucosamine/UDP-N-acetylgalactosamine diphosphorylase
VTLAGGFFSGATFLDGVTFGSSGHVRPGTLLEEQASCAHSVGLKQTLLMPFVVTGSLVNFCDCLMAGGTCRKNHSEVGSSYVHFNFTPHGDKATASLIGDVPRGVLLNEAPIFLGGQGGLVGPARIAYGTVIAAGTVWRRDISEPGQLGMAGGGHASRSIQYDPTKFADMNRVVANNMRYIGNLHALLLWYRHVRAPFFGVEPTRRLVFDGAVRQLNAMLSERLKRLDELVAKLREANSGRSPTEQPEFNRGITAKWPAIVETLRGKIGMDHATALRDRFLQGLDSFGGTAGYVAFIQRLPPVAKASATGWLQAEVDAITTGS